MNGKQLKQMCKEARDNWNFDIDEGETIRAGLSAIERQADGIAKNVFPQYLKMNRWNEWSALSEMALVYGRM